MTNWKLNGYSCRYEKCMALKSPLQKNKMASVLYFNANNGLRYTEMYNTWYMLWDG